MDVAENVMEIKTEADSNVITEIQYPHNDKPGTGTSGFLWCYILNIICPSMTRSELALFSYCCYFYTQT